MKLFHMVRMVLMEGRIWMQTLILATCKINLKLKTNNSASGFTFLEILVAITLLVLLMGTIVPQFFALFSKAHELEYKHLKSVLNQVSS